MKKFLRFSGFFAFAFLIASCGSDSTKQSSPNPVLSGFEYLPKGSLNVTTNRVSGTGTVLFRQPLQFKSTDFTLTYSLEEGGSLTLVAYGDTALKNAVQLRFSRKSDALEVRYRTGEGAWKTPSPNQLDGVPADNALTAVAQLHNDENPPHGQVRLDGKLAVIEEGDLVKGTGGEVWGVILDKATLNSVKQAEGKH